MSRKMKWKFPVRKYNSAFETIQLERALSSINIPASAELEGKGLHELTFEEFKALYAVGALEITRFNRLMHWEKFLSAIYFRGIIKALQDNLEIPLNVLESNRYRIPYKYVRPYLRMNGIKRQPLDCFIKKTA